MSGVIVTGTSGSFLPPGTHFSHLSTHWSDEESSGVGGVYEVDFYYGGTLWATTTVSAWYVFCTRPVQRRRLTEVSLARPHFPNVLPSEPKDLPDLVGAGDGPGVGRGRHGPWNRVTVGCVSRGSCTDRLPSGERVTGSSVTGPGGITYFSPTRQFSVGRDPNLVRRGCTGSQTHVG